MKKIIFKTYILPIIIFIAVAAIIVILAYHKHSWGEWEIKNEPTCSSHGSRIRYCYCGEHQTSSIDMLEHEREDEWIISADGEQQYIKCKNCDKILETKPVEKHTHSFGEWITEKPATCTEEGILVRNCECGFKDSVRIPKESHTFSDWTIIKEPECGVEGLKKRMCSCGEAEEETLNALEHTEGGWVVNGTIKEYRCIYCDEIIKTEEIEASEGLIITDGVVMGIGSCSDKHIVIPSEHDGITVTKINSRAFYYSDIESLVLPNSIEYIGEKAFYECAKLEIISLGNGVKEIGDNAFFGCKLLKSVTIPDSTISMGSNVFAYCEALETIYIGSGLRSIPSRAFNFCISLKEIHYNGSITDWESIEKGREWDEFCGEYTIIYE